jgi:hypothetical protein
MSLHSILNKTSRGRLAVCDLISISQQTDFFIFSFSESKTHISILTHIKKDQEGAFGLY